MPDRKEFTVGWARSQKAVYRRGYNFVVYLDGCQIPFQKVSGLSDEAGFETLQEGGYNRGAHYLIQPGSGERTVTLEMGLLPGEAEMQEFFPGCRFEQEVAIYVLGSGVGTESSVSIAAKYYLQRAFVRRISLSELQASTSGLMIATLELGYSSLEQEQE
ncbi:MAG: phage tail protein [Eubacteriales bacterium]|nr:phage tail protein [Eubacteriales bacterium]